MPIELSSTGFISPLITLDASLPLARSSDALVIPPRRVPSGLVSNNEVISANWDYGFNSGTSPTVIPPSPPPSTTPPSIPLQDDPKVGPEVNLEDAHTDLEIFKAADRPKQSIETVLDKMAAAAAKWDDQFNKAMSNVHNAPDLLTGFIQQTNQASLNAAQIPSSDPIKNMTTTVMLLQTQIAVQKMAEATSSFMHSLMSGEVSMKPIGSSGPYVPLAPPPLSPPALSPSKVF